MRSEIRSLGKSEFYQYSDRKVRVNFDIQQFNWDEVIAILDKSKSLRAKHSSGRRLVEYTFLQKGSHIAVNVELKRFVSSMSLNIYPVHKLWSTSKAAIIEASSHIDYLLNSTSLT